MFLNTAILLGLFCLGAAVGSFISVVIYRLHTGKRGIFGGRSVCTNCDKQLKPLDLIPIASYLTLRGKCRYCSKEISYMYPLLEILTGLLFAALYFKFPFLDAETLRITTPLLGMYLLYGFYTFILVFTFFFDLHYMNIADEVVLPGVLIALIATMATPYTPHIIDALLGLGIGVVFFGLQALISKGKWIGLGDLRVGAFMGAVLGWKLMIVALFLSYLVGSVVALFIIIKKKQVRGIRVPFAPFLVTGTFITIFFGEQLMNWYLSGLYLIP